MFQFLPQFPEVTAVLSEKGDGNMKIRNLAKDHDVLVRRRDFYAKNAIEEEGVVSALLSHSTDVVTVKDATQQFFLPEDALVTDASGVFLAVTVADCLPVFFYDPVARVIGLAHAGWKGAVGEIVLKTAEAMVACGAQMKNIHVTIGPHICSEHFEFGREKFYREFGKYAREEYIKECQGSGAVERRTASASVHQDGIRKKGAVKGSVYVDLASIVRDQLEDTGILEKNIVVHEACTMEDERLLSARAQGENFKAMIAVIGMRE